MESSTNPEPGQNQQQQIEGEAVSTQAGASAGAGDTAPNEGSGGKLKFVRFASSDKPCRITAAHPNGLVDVEEFYIPDGELDYVAGRWFQNISRDQITTLEPEAVQK